MGRPAAAIDSICVSTYKVPTSSPEADGTFKWDATTLVLVQVEAAGQKGIGYTYSHSAAADLISKTLANVVRGRDAMDVTAVWHAMIHTVRNLGLPGICAMAISAVDTALWDLKAKLLDLPLCKLFGQLRDEVPVYGSGGFTTYSDKQMRDQFSHWLALGIGRMKMKIGSHPEDDLHRVSVAREAAGEGVELFVDANGAFDVKQALWFAERLELFDVRWFEEPVSSDDLPGLREIRERAPASMNIAAGEYGFDQFYFRSMLEAQAVDILQADATRCCGFTGFLQADTLCDAYERSLSAHCAPALHMHVAAAARQLRHVEYFHDHARIESLFFDGFREPRNGAMHPDLSRPGLGLEFKAQDAERFAA